MELDTLNLLGVSLGLPIDTANTPLDTLAVREAVQPEVAAALGDEVRAGNIPLHRNPNILAAVESSETSANDHNAVAQLQVQSQEWPERANPSQYIARLNAEASELGVSAEGVQTLLPEVIQGYEAAAAPEIRNRYNTTVKTDIAQSLQRLLSFNVSDGISEARFDFIQNGGTEEEFDIQRTQQLLDATLETVESDIGDGISEARFDFIQNGGTEEEFNTLTAEAVIEEAIAANDEDILNLFVDPIGIVPRDLGQRLPDFEDRIAEAQDTILAQGVATQVDSDQQLFTQTRQRATESLGEVLSGAVSLDELVTQEGPEIREHLQDLLIPFEQGGATDTTLRAFVAATTGELTEEDMRGVLRQSLEGIVTPEVFLQIAQAEADNAEIIPELPLTRFTPLTEGLADIRRLANNLNTTNLDGLLHGVPGGRSLLTTQTLDNEQVAEEVLGRALNGDDVSLIMRDIRRQYYDNIEAREAEGIQIVEQYTRLQELKAKAASIGQLQRFEEQGVLSQGGTDILDELRTDASTKLSQTEQDAIQELSSSLDEIDSIRSSGNPEEADRLLEELRKEAVGASTPERKDSIIDTLISRFKR